MKRPTPEQLREFFQSDVFSSGAAAPGNFDFEEAIEAFYKRFDSEFDQLVFNQIGIHINRIHREPYLIEETGQDEVVRIVDTRENKTTVYFHFLKEPGKELSFILWGAMEEEPFFEYGKEELLQFFELRFRRFCTLLIY